MKRLTLLLAVGLLFLSSISCGGGGGVTTPPVNDISGLVGTWAITINISGLLYGAADPTPVANTYQETWVIIQNQIHEQRDDEYLAWQYDGSTLIIIDGDNSTEWEDACGNMIYTRQHNYQISISPGATTGVLSGTVDTAITSDFCYDLWGVLNMTGNMTKLS